MTEHLPIQNPLDYGDEDMMAFAEQLFSPLTPVDTLERICMTLAHLPTEEAQGLLRRFSTSERASEVSWLECAVDEGAYHLLMPANEQEEREFLALKMIEDITDELVDLMTEQDALDLKQRKSELRDTAIRALVEVGRLEAEELLGLDDERLSIENELAELDKRIKREKLIQEQLESTIETPKYLTADRAFLRHIHLD